MTGVCSDSGTCRWAATIQLSSASTMKLSMIVTITSLAPEARLEGSGNRASDASARCRGDAAQQHRDDARRGGGQGKPHDRRTESAERQLPFGADVEQSRPESDGDGEARERQRGCLVQHLAEAVAVSPGAVRQQAIDLRRRLPNRENEHVTDNEGDGQRDERRQQEGDGAPHHAAPRVAPVIQGPSESADASARGIVTTMRPAYMTATLSARANTSTRSAETSRMAAPASRAARSLS